LIARFEAWGRRPILGAYVKIAGPKHYSGETADSTPIERSAAREAHLQGGAAGSVRSLKTRRQGRSVIGDDQIAAAQEINELNSGDMADVAACIDDQKFGMRWTLDRESRRNHQ
jgi:hypothetical protein